uniref:Variant surface glycoprotein 1132 n=1 Tax=Trypanosoma brucei TaxID=5691 RepID=M4SXQ1_9TRYP|nr:variant surface glycoprotein 1132 [Trypanosoma brucei]
MLRQKAQKSAVLLAAFVAEVFAQDEDSSVEAIKSTCDEAVWLQTVQDHYIKNVQTATARNSDLLTEARRLTLAAAQASDQTRRGVLSSLAAVADQREAQVAAILNQETPSLLAAVALLNERRGNVRALYRLMNTQTSAVISGSTVGACGDVLFSSTTAKCSLIASLDKTATEDCKITEESGPKLATAGQHLNKITKIKTTPLTAFAIPQLDVDIETKGTLTSGDTNANSSNKCANDRTKGSEARGVGLTKLTLKQTQTKPSDANLAEDNICIQATKESDHYITTGSQVANAICQLKGLMKSLPRKIADETADSLNTDPTLQNAIYLALSQEKNINESTEKKNRKGKNPVWQCRDQTIRQIFPTFNEDNIKYNVGEQTVTTSVAKAACDSNYAIALAFLQKSQHNTSHSKKCNRTDGSAETTKERECGNKKDKGKYKEKKRTDVNSKMGSAKLEMEGKRKTRKRKKQTQQEEILL